MIFIKNMGYGVRRIKTGGEGNRVYTYVRDNANNLVE